MVYNLVEIKDFAARSLRKFQTIASKGRFFEKGATSDLNVAEAEKQLRV